MGTRLIRRGLFLFFPVGGEGRRAMGFKPHTEGLEMLGKQQKRRSLGRGYRDSLGNSSWRIPC